MTQRYYYLRLKIRLRNSSNVRTISDVMGSAEALACLKGTTDFDVADYTLMWTVSSRSLYSRWSRVTTNANDTR